MPVMMQPSKTRPSSPCRSIFLVYSTTFANPAGHFRLDTCVDHPVNALGSMQRKGKGGGCASKWGYPPGVAGQEGRGQNDRGK